MKSSKFKRKKKMAMIGLAISSGPLNTSLFVQSVQFTSVPCSNILRKQYNNFLKHAMHAIL